MKSMEIRISGLYTNQHKEAMKSLITRLTRVPAIKSNNDYVYNVNVDNDTAEIIEALSDADCLSSRIICE